MLLFLLSFLSFMILNICTTNSIYNIKNNQILIANYIMLIVIIYNIKYISINSYTLFFQLSCLSSAIYNFLRGLIYTILTFIRIQLTNYTFRVPIIYTYAERSEAYTTFIPSVARYSNKNWFINSSISLSGFFT